MRRRCNISAQALCLLLLACGDEGTSGLAAAEAGRDSGVAGDADSADAASTSDAGIDASADASTSDAGIDASADASNSDAQTDAGTQAPVSIDRLREDWGILETVAGTGVYRDKGFNGWDATDEGGSATLAELSRPHITLSDRDGNLYIADKDAHAVRKVAPDGTITTFAGTGSSGFDGDAPQPANQQRLASPNGLWLGPVGQVYIYDYGNDRVRLVDQTGTMRTLFIVGGSSSGRGIWVRDDGKQAYVAAGTLLKEWTPEGGVRVLSNGFVSLGNVHVSPAGVLAVADRLGHRVYEIDRSTGAKTVIAGNGTSSGGSHGDLATSVGLDEVRGIWFHPDGGFLVCTHKGGQVWYVDPTGLAHVLVDGDTDHSHTGDGEHFATPGKKISEPRAVTIAPDGAMLITESDYGFVRRIALR